MVTPRAQKKTTCFNGNYLLTLLITVIFQLSFSTVAGSSGFQIPNQSLRAVGIAGATIAYTPGPDAAFYNPANMSFLEDSWAVEASVTTLYLPEIEYSDTRSPLLNGSSETELFFLPQVHVSSKDYNKFRFGFSLTYPYGLTKEWRQPYPAATANKFSLFVIEANPSVAYLLSDKFSIAGGVRIIYSEGEVKNGATNPPFSALSPLTGLSRDIDSSDDVQVGYNLAATYRPTPALRLAATYKSEVNLDLEGDALLQALSGEIIAGQYNGQGTLPISLPAVFSLAAAYTFDDLTIELAWNRTYWSAIEELDFQYSQPLLGTAFDAFDRPQPKNWDDSDAIRLGFTYRINDSFLATAGFAIDDTPVPDSTLGFELPDADAYMYCLGIQYKTSDRMRLGVSYMYHHTTSRSVTTLPIAGLPEIDGEFTDGGAHAVTVGVISTF